MLRQSMRRCKIGKAKGGNEDLLRYAQETSKLRIADVEMMCLRLLSLAMLVKGEESLTIGQMSIPKPAKSESRVDTALGPLLCCMQLEQDASLTRISQG